MVFKNQYLIDLLRQTETIFSIYALRLLKDRKWQKILRERTMQIQSLKTI